MIPVIVRGIVTAVKTILGLEKTVEEVIEVTTEVLDPEPKQPGHPLTYRDVEHQRAQEQASILASKAAAARAADKAAAQQAAEASDRTLFPHSRPEPGPSSRDTPTPPAVPRLMPLRPPRR